MAEAREGYARTEQRAREEWRPWAPYGLESRVLGIQATYLLGDWDAATAMADLRHESPPELAEAMVDRQRHDHPRRARRGVGAAAAAVDRVDLAQREGMAAMFSGFAAIDLHGDRGDLSAAIAAHDDAIRVIGTLWANKDFQARIRMSALLLGHVATAVPDIGSHDRDDLVALARSLARHRPPDRPGPGGLGLGRGAGGQGVAGAGRGRARPVPLAGRRRPAAARASWSRAGRRQSTPSAGSATSSRPRGHRCGSPPCCGPPAGPRTPTRW